MTNKDLDELLLAYETDTRFPDVSGVEHLDMLLTRSKIEKNKENLNQEQKKRLDAADQNLIEQSRQFYAAIQEIADLAAWREEKKMPVSHWWWYLDVLAFAWPQIQPVHTAILQPV